LKRGTHPIPLSNSWVSCALKIRTQIRQMYELQPVNCHNSNKAYMITDTLSRQRSQCITHRKTAKTVNGNESIIVLLYCQNVPLSKRPVVETSQSCNVPSQNVHAWSKRPESNRLRFDNRLDNRLYRVYKHSMYTNIQPVVQPVVQPLVRFRLDNRFDNGTF